MANSEDDSNQIVSSRPGGSGPRRLGENLAPLIQFLHKNIGRPWSSVYADICRLAAPGSASERQLLDHVNSLVAISVVVIDAKPHRVVQGAGSNTRLVALTGSKWDSLYVCPKAGVLASVERPHEPLRKKPDPDVRPIGPLSQYRRINGVWYLVELAYIPSIVAALSSHYDVVFHASLADISSEDLRRTYGAYDRYAVSKRPLGKMELLRLADVLGGS